MLWLSCRAQSYAERLRLGLAVIHGEAQCTEQDMDDGRHSPPMVKNATVHPGLELPCKTELQFGQQPHGLVGKWLLGWLCNQPDGCGTSGSFLLERLQEKVQGEPLVVFTLALPTQQVPDDKVLIKVVPVQLLAAKLLELMKQERSERVELLWEQAVGQAAVPTMEGRAGFVFSLLL